MSLAGLALAVVLAGSGPKVEFGPLRKVSFLPMGRCDIDVAFRLTVDDAGSEDYYCPRVEWYWEDGTTSEEESDCPPFAEATPEEHRRVWMRRRAFQTSGRYLVRVRLFKADRAIHEVDAEAVVKGWSGFPPERREENGCSPARPSPVEPPRPPFPRPGDFGRDPPW